MRHTIFTFSNTYHIPLKSPNTAKGSELRLNRQDVGLIRLPKRLAGGAVNPLFVRQIQQSVQQPSQPAPNPLPWTPMVDGEIAVAVGFRGRSKDRGLSPDRGRRRSGRYSPERRCRRSGRYTSDRGRRGEEGHGDRSVGSSLSPPRLKRSRIHGRDHEKEEGEVPE